MLCAYSKDVRCLHHGLLVLAIFHLCCGQVNDATLHWVFVAVIDKDIRATDHDKMFSPVAVKWLLEMQVSFLRDHGAKKGSTREVSFSQKESDHGLRNMKICLT